MNQAQSKDYKELERGSASTKLLIVAIILFLFGHAGYNYIPIAYEGQDLEEQMQSAVTKGAAMANLGKPLDSVKAHLANAMKGHPIPANAFFNVQEIDGVIQAKLRYTKKIDLLPFGLYQYDYVFDTTVTPAGMFK